MKIKAPNEVNIIVYGTIFPYSKAGTGDKNRYKFFMEENEKIYKHGELKGECIEKQLEDCRKYRKQYPEAIFCLAGDFNLNLHEDNKVDENGLRLLELLDEINIKPLTTDLKEKDIYEKSLLNDIIEKKAEATIFPNSQLIDHICSSENWLERGIKERMSESKGKWIPLSDHNLVYACIGIKP